MKKAISMKQQCRCCLSTTADSYCDIFEQHNKFGTTCADDIRYLAEVQIERDDGLTQQICSNCFDQVHHIYEFSLNVRLADEKLRQELEAKQHQTEDEVQMENLQVLENEYFDRVDDENGIQVSVMEEMLEEEPEPDDIVLAEDIHVVDMVEINLKEEILDLGINHDEKSNNQRENLLVSLAQVAATQENVNIINDHSLNEDVFFPEDEIDEDYLIEFDTHEINNFKPPKWKCNECKIILRGDVSYEGHMNIHKQLRPHKCSQCQTQFRCRAALKRHKDLRHEQQSKIQNDNTPSHVCLECNKKFYFENIFYLHKVLVHDHGKKCPFCPCSNVENFKKHIQNNHAKLCNPSEQMACVNEPSFTISPIYQCYKCAKIFDKLDLLECHAKVCYDKDEHIDSMILEEDDSSQPIITVAECLVQCEICKRKLQKKNFNKHMELHKRKDIKDPDKSRKYLCAFCPREFKNSKSLHQHEKTHQGECSDVVYVCGDCERQYTSQYLLETHRKQAHKERDNVCFICGNAFKLKNQLVNHMKLHLEKNIPCPHCDKKYARHFDLNVHLRSHTGEQPYACHLCDKRFAIKVRLTYHLQKHYGIKHQCKVCNAEFNSKQKLKAHSFKHTGMPYRCELCDDHGFATRNVFKRHLNRVHQATVTEEALNEMFQHNTGKTVKIKQVNDHSLAQISDDEYVVGK